jgi:hypothetical protein
LVVSITFLRSAVFAIFPMAAIDSLLLTKISRPWPRDV